MILEEVVYQVDGELRVEELEGAVRVSLLDNIGDICRVNFNDKPSVVACAYGTTLEKTRQNLVDLLKGNVLIHYWPEMWKSRAGCLRIPSTLTADTVEDRLSKQNIEVLK